MAVGLAKVVGNGAPHTSISLSRERVVELARKLESSQKKLATIQGKGEKHAGEVLEAGEYLGTILALGFARGRFGSFDVKGIPAEVLGGLLCHAVGFSGFLGKHSGDVHNIGNASLGFALGLEAVALGEKSREKVQKGPTVMDRAKAIADEAQQTVNAIAQSRQQTQAPAPSNAAVLPPARPTASDIFDQSVPKGAEVPRT